MVVVTQDYGEARGSSFVLPSGAFYVRLLVTPTPAVRYQVSEGNAPDIYFAGWASFGYQNAYGVRNNVSFAGSGFFVPDSATHFAYSLVFGAVAIARVYRRIPIAEA